MSLPAFSQVGKLNLEKLVNDTFQNAMIPVSQLNPMLYPNTHFSYFVCSQGIERTCGVPN